MGWEQWVLRDPIGPLEYALSEVRDDLRVTAKGHGRTRDGQCYILTDRKGQPPVLSSVEYDGDWSVADSLVAMKWYDLWPGEWVKDDWYHDLPRTVFAGLHRRFDLEQLRAIDTGRDPLADGERSRALALLELTHMDDGRPKVRWPKFPPGRDEHRYRGFAARFSDGTSVSVPFLISTDIVIPFDGTGVDFSRSSVIWREEVGGLSHSMRSDRTGLYEVIGEQRRRLADPFPAYYETLQPYGQMRHVLHTLITRHGDCVEFAPSLAREEWL